MSKQAKELARIEFHCPQCKGTIMRKVTEPGLKKCPWCKYDFPEKPKECEFPDCGGKLPICGTTNECKKNLGRASKKKPNKGIPKIGHGIGG